MNIVVFRENYNENVGRVKSIEGGSLVVNINAGRNLTGDMTLPLKSCYKFVPEVGDRVLLCVDDDADIQGYILTKFTKNRQK